MSAMGGKQALTQYAASVTVYRPRPSFWLPLLIPMAFPIYLGIAALLDGDFLGFAGLAFAGAVVGYNATIRLVVGEEISFARYGRTLWRVQANGVHVTSGRAGEIPILPAFVLTDQNDASGAVPKSMLRPSDTARLKSTIEDRRGVWRA